MLGRWQEPGGQYLRMVVSRVRVRAMPCLEVLTVQITGARLQHEIKSPLEMELDYRLRTLSLLIFQCLHGMDVTLEPSPTSVSPPHNAAMACPRGLSQKWRSACARSGLQSWSRFRMCLVRSTVTDRKPHWHILKMKVILRIHEAMARHHCHS